MPRADRVEGLLRQRLDTGQGVMRIEHAEDRIEMEMIGIEGAEDHVPAMPTEKGRQRFRAIPIGPLPRYPDDREPPGTRCGRIPSERGTPVSFNHPDRG